MFLRIPQVLKPDEIKSIISILNQSEFVDGNLTAGFKAKGVKNNLQLSHTDTNRKQIEPVILQALFQHELVQRFAFPKYIFGLLFNKYEAGMYYGNHIDNPIMTVGQPRRTDLSVTVFLNSPETYEGGELIIETVSGSAKLKLLSGDAILYPSSSLHRVEPVTKGVRLAAVCWIQSFIHSQQERELLYELGLVHGSLSSSQPESKESEILSKCYANLLRLWAEV